MIASASGLSVAGAAAGGGGAVATVRTVGGGGMGRRPPGEQTLRLPLEVRRHLGQLFDETRALGEEPAPRVEGGLTGQSIANINHCQSPRSSAWRRAPRKLLASAILPEYARARRSPPLESPL